MTGGYHDETEPRMRWLRVSRTHGVSHSVTASIESGTLRNADRTDFWLRWPTWLQKIDHNT